MLLIKYCGILLLRGPDIEETVVEGLQRSIAEYYFSRARVPSTTNELLKAGTLGMKDFSPYSVSHLQFSKAPRQESDSEFRFFSQYRVNGRKFRSEILVPLRKPEAVWLVRYLRDKAGAIDWDRPRTTPENQAHLLADAVDNHYFATPPKQLADLKNTYEFEQYARMKGKKSFALRMVVLDGRQRLYLTDLASKKIYKYAFPKPLLALARVEVERAR